jgi:transposase
MAIVAGFDVHRAQITFDALDTATGEVNRGRIEATPAAVGRWAKRFGGRELHVAVEACTGWLFVCDALVAAGAWRHLAEPVETRALRGRKRRAKTDREDARWLRRGFSAVAAHAHSLEVLGRVRARLPAEPITPLSLHEAGPSPMTSP